MSPEPSNPAIASLVLIRDEAARDLQKARKELDKAKAKVAKAEAGLAALNDAVARISGTPASNKSQKDEIFEIIKAANGNGISVIAVLEALEERGMPIDGKNPQAAVHVAATRLAEDGLIEIVPTVSGKIFRIKPGAEVAGTGDHSE